MLIKLNELACALGRQSRPDVPLCQCISATHDERFGRLQRVYPGMQDHPLNNLRLVQLSGAVLEDFQSVVYRRLALLDIPIGTMTALTDEGVWEHDMAILPLSLESPPKLCHCKMNWHTHGTIGRTCQSGAAVRSMFEINISAGHLWGRGFDSRSNPFLMW
jgi:hypothetical protein